MTLKPILAISAFVLAGLSFGQATLSSSIPNPETPAGKWARKRIPLSIVATAPKVDGVLDDACWTNATRGVGFYRFLSNDPIREQTEMWMCSDNKSLFFAFHCLESKPESIVAKETQRNGEFDQDDKIVILIDTQSQRRNVSEFGVNAIGTQWQSLEGGSADNQAWQGDWTAVTKRVSDGWIVEIAIPFSMLRYPKGAKSFGMFFGRKKANETNFMTWPYAPPESDTGSIAQYLHDFDGITPPYFAPKPTISPYMLATTGQGNSARFGMDIKAPLSTTMTGLVTIKPDFQTVEGAVQDLSFSYTEKYIPDRRPFFAEGGGFLDDSFLFYSNRIQDVDFGLKVTGKQGPTSVGVLATTAGTGTKQSAQVANFDHELGQYTGFGGTFLNSHQAGNTGQVGQIRGQYGWAKGKRNFRFFSNFTQSWQDGGAQGNAYAISANSYAGKGELNVNLYYNSTNATFKNPLGLVGDVDAKGGGLNLNSFQSYDKGAIEERSTFGGGNIFTRQNGDPFEKNIYLGTSIGFRAGYGVFGELAAGEREAFKDRSMFTGLNWNTKSLLNQGGFSIGFGRRQNQPMRNLSINQGFAIGKRASVNLSFGEYRLGATPMSQIVMSGTYRVTPLETFGGRWVVQGGQSNVYFSYGKRTRQGNDVFVLFGDPNSPTTRRAITLKLVRSL